MGRRGCGTGVAVCRHVTADGRQEDTPQPVLIVRMKKRACLETQGVDKLNGERSFGGRQMN